MRNPAVLRQHARKCYHGAMIGVHEFLARRKGFTNEYLASPGSKKTVLISSYIWWTELLAYELLKLGYNVLIAEPWYYMWISEQHWTNFDSIYKQWVDLIRKMNVQLVIGANSTIAVPHPRTKELLHRAAGVPAVTFWWDEPRRMPPMAKRGLTGEDHLAAMKDDRTLTVFWDKDVAEEMARYFGVKSIHVPLGATPEFWEGAYRPLAQRPMKLCFLGNNHIEGDWTRLCAPNVLQWARSAAKLKLGNLDRPMVQCVDEAARGAGLADAASPTGAGPAAYQVDANLANEFIRWGILDAALLTECRNQVVQAAADRLGKEFILVGKGWNRLGLTAQKEHSGIAGAKDYYSGSQASLNLFGGCVHGGMPLRPYEIAAGNGLVFTQYNRELPDLFEPGRECVAFGTPDEMVAALDRILAAPREYDAVVEAGRRRVLAEHTWARRLERVLNAAKERFDLPW